MPFKSKAQQRYLESSASPLTEAQKREFESATDFSRLPARSKTVAKARGRGGNGATVARSGGQMKK